MNGARVRADAPSRRPAARGKRRPRRRADEAPPDREPPASPAEPASVPGISRIGTLLGAVVAPTTLLTALLYYFGWAHAYYFFGHFGVSSTLLGFTTTDYLMRSADALFRPMSVGAVAVLVWFWADGRLYHRLAGRPGGWTVRILVSILLAIAVASTVGGAVSTFRRPAAQDLRSAIAPVVFAFGVLLTSYAVKLRRRLATRRDDGESDARPWASAVEWAVVFAFVGIGLFAAATNYAAAVGRSRAEHFAGVLAMQPDVVIYSAKNLSLREPGVREVSCADPLAAYRFRYQGLKLVLQSGGLYLFLPAAWTPDAATAILIPRSDSIRLEFYAGSSHADPPDTC